MSTAPAATEQRFKKTVISGITCVLISSSCLKPISVSEIAPYGTSRQGRSEIRRWSDDVGVGSTASAATQVGNWLAELEQQLHLTRAGLAALLNVSRPTLYSWARGEGIREANAQRLQGLRAAAKLLILNAPDGAVPALWQHQQLPSFSMSFAQGMVERNDPEAMAREIVEMWARDSAESTAIDRIFAKRG